MYSIFTYCLQRNIQAHNCDQTRVYEADAQGGGSQLFFQVGVCGPDFQSVGLAKWYLPLKRGACELKMSQFGGLWAKIWVKIEAVEAKISKFSQKGVLWTDSFAWNGTLANYRRGVKRGSSGPHIPIPLSRSVPPQGWCLAETKFKCC